MSEQNPDTRVTPVRNRFSSFYHDNPWKGRLLISLLTLIILFSIIRLLLTPVIIYGTTDWLKQQGIDASIEDIKISLLKGTVSLLDAKGYQDKKPLFNIGLVDIHWRWSPLSDKTIEVTKVVLDEFKIDIEQYSDELIIGGLHLPTDNPEPNSHEETEQEATAEIKPWAASLSDVIIGNLNICYLQHHSSHAQASDETRLVDYCIDLKEMHWSGTISYATDRALLDAGELPLSSTGNFELNGLQVTDNRLGKQLLLSRSNSLSDVVITGLNKIQIGKLTMNDLSALQRDDDKHNDTVRFKRLLIADIELNDLDRLSIKTLSIDQPGLYIVRRNATDWEYMQWLPITSGKTEQIIDQTTAGAPTANTSSSFTFSLQAVSITATDACYQDINSNLYYCLNEDALSWQGPVAITTDSKETKVTAAGELSITGVTITNPKLQRKLLAIKSMALNKLQMKAVDDIAFADLKLDDMKALQRGAKADDSSAAFSQLHINKLHYTGDAVAINSILLDGVSARITKNKDGSWEFDKWPTGTGQSAGTAGAGGQKDNTSSTDRKPFMISLRKTEIRTEKELLFIDNSTSPAMTLGLSKLDASIRGLDSARPETDSPFKLAAKTTRHGTINIEGTARPLADKISFDAKGKLKGFDLRAATPAVQKAIGHKIKSGQMDADLTLLAKDGILDSNISLSLYQFNIKADSKEDADKLDKQFGMPLNQTLVLLRDKDDSIHLDIPITGDINKPEFNPMDAIVKATSKAATATLITFYTPYGLAYYGGSAIFDLATALNFDPIKFRPGSAEISADSTQQLEKMSKLLSEKPQVHLTLCGITNNQDTYALFPELRTAADKQAKAIKLSKEQSAALDRLARERQVNSKNYLVEKAGIAHERLILCDPEHRTDDDAIAGVEINI